MRRFSFAIILIFIIACKNKNNTTIHKKYYPSGGIKALYKILNDSTPIDTFFTFYENGKVEGRLVYDSLGRLDGIAKIFYENGRVSSITNYIEGMAQGDMYSYDSLGNLEFKAFYYNDVEVGNYYEYNNNNKVGLYKFLRFQNLYKDHFLNVIEYDSHGKIIKEITQSLFIDSIKIDFNKNNYDSCKILLILSNPPGRSNKIDISYYDQLSGIIRKDTTGWMVKPVFYKDQVFKTGVLSFIQIVVSQFDSTTNRIKVDGLKVNIQ
jgi:antitoxin component YwqK of YwqJK toxin-antitoxin module